jgi:AcrR family transcriptional regulator
MDLYMDKYHHGNLKAVLLKAAFQLVGKLGAEGFTLREVARRAGVSHNAPYRHFKSKEDLIAALATEAFRQLHEALRHSIADGDDPTAQLRAASRAYLHFALENRPRFNVMFHSQFDRTAYPEYVSAYKESLVLLGQLIDANKRVSLNTDTAGELVWASIHGIAELGLAGRLRKGVKADLERLVDAAITTLLGGMKESARTSSPS